MVKIGVMGCGYWGSKHIRNFHELPDADLAVVCDLNPERREQIKGMYPNLAVTDSYSDFLDSDVDGIVIATPPLTHYALAREALSRGKHVLVEKPLTTSSYEASHLVILAEERERILMVGHTYEYNPAVEFLKEYIQSGELGDLYYIDSARLNLGAFQRDVDVVWDLAPHDLSMFRYILGQEPLSVSARGAAHINPKICEVAYVELKFPDNVLAHVHLSWLDPRKVRRMTIVGSKKMAVFDDMSDSDRIRIYNSGVSVNADGQDFRYPPVSYRHGEVFIPHIPPAEPLTLECQHFVDSIRDGTTPRSDGRARPGPSQEPLPTSAPSSLALRKRTRP